MFTQLHFSENCVSSCVGRSELHQCKCTFVYNLFVIRKYFYNCPTINIIQKSLLQKVEARITGSEVRLEIGKREPTNQDNAWPRLTKDSAKCAWIKPDFDKMDISDDEDVELLDRKRVCKLYYVISYSLRLSPRLLHRCTS